MESRFEEEKKMKVLCLHGFRTSGSFLRKQISKWDPSIFEHFEMVFPDGLFPAGGKSDIESIFPSPYYEWFQFNKEFTGYTNLDECISFLCNYITEKGPFDGLLGFSQGATLSALLLGYQAHGKVLKVHPPIKFFVSISGSKFRDPGICEVAYKESIKAKSVHFIGDKDWLKLPSEDLATAFESPLILRHPQGHTVPRLDEAAVKQLTDWTSSILAQSHGEHEGPASKATEIQKNEINLETTVDQKNEAGRDPDNVEAREKLMEKEATLERVVPPVCNEAGRDPDNVEAREKLMEKEATLERVVPPVCN